jgi:hypothetical protein
MKKITFLVVLFFSIVTFAQPQTVTYGISPIAFEETTSITITINGNSINESSWGSGNALYIWAWSFDNNDENSIDCPTNGSWTNSNESNKFTYNSGDDTYTLTFVPTTFYNRIGIGRIGFLVKAKDGTGDKKSQDVYAEVGSFQVTLNTPAQNSTTILTSGGSLAITATNSNGVASYNLKANGVSIDANPSTSSYSFTHSNIASNQNYVLEVIQGATTITKRFTVMINPGTISEALPSGVEEGINYNLADPTKATLVLDAPGKDFVYVAGSFNNYQPGSSYSMKKDPTTGKFWLELTGLTSGTNYNYQYWMVDTTPLSGSPGLVKTADPYSTLVLSPFDDPTIPATSYPNMPVYPAGQEREVTVLRTGQTAYNWQVTNFNKPKKEDLIVYEVLIRDFDANRNFQDLINKIDYFKNLKVNAIELMPVMEFEGNESWGYNTSFHMALDKFYGTSDKFKEFVDLCHQNGIAVILDVALNHAFGRNPMVRMWMKDADGDGWGDASSENPYFNEVAKHSYSVGNDFNHSTAVTKTYVKRVVKQWIQEYKIDGFRWDLTKGFTQMCSAGDDACTNGSPSDRVPILKDYVDYSWNLDPTHYAIFEHLGSDSEEKQWADYKIDETPSKGVMMWAEITYQYSQLLGGWAADADISRIGANAHGFAAKRVMGYPESHDKERLMYTAMTYGQTSGPFPPNGSLNNTLARMSAIGASSLLVPGPKMIWHFAELGMQNSIYDCNNGTVNTENDAAAGDCKLNTKPQPQWTENWLGVSQRLKIYNDWSKMIALKINEPVFEGNYAISPDANNVKQRIYIYDEALPTTQLKNVVVLCNFSVANLSIVPNFPYAGTWYNLMDNTSINVTDVNAALAIPSGQFLIYGNQKSTTLETSDFGFIEDLHLYPNPSSTYFTINANTSKVEVYSIAGQLVKSFNAVQAKGYQFTISDLNEGMYFVRTLDENNAVKVFKFIKQ